MRGVTQLRYSPSTVKEVFSTIVEKSSKDLRATTAFEFFPLKKINSVSNEACAFNIRGEASNVLNIVTWDVDNSENAKLGKELCHIMSDIVAKKEEKPADSKERAYGNYGASQSNIV